MGVEAKDGKSTVETLTEEAMSDAKVVTLAAADMQRLIDLVCRVHKLCLHHDSFSTILAGQLEIAESELTKELETAHQTLKAKLLKQTGIVW